MMILILLGTVALNGLLSVVFVELALMDHAARTQLEYRWPIYRKARKVTFGVSIPGLLVGNILLSATLAIDPEMRWAFGLNTLLLGGVLLITIGFHFPIKTAIRSRAFDTPRSNWNTVRLRWRRWNWIRCGLAYGAFTTAFVMAAFSLSFKAWT